VTLQENSERQVLEEKAEERRRLRAQQMSAKQQSRRMCVAFTDISLSAQARFDSNVIEYSQ